MAGLFDFITTPVSKAEDPLAAREKWLGLASIFQGMTMDPTAGQAGIQTQLQGIQQQRQQTSAAEKLQKQSQMALQLLGDKFPMLSGAVKSGIMSPSDAIQAARKGGDAKVVGKALVGADGTVIYRDTDDKAGQTTAFQTLHQKAIAGGLQEGTPEYRQYMLEGGAKKGLAFRMNADGSFELSEGGASPIKLTETQGKATGFYDRANKANQVIAGLESQGTNFGQALLGMVPFDAANWAKTPERQQYEQAKRDFINAVLRQESGAAIGKDEFTNADVQYFPQVGDSQQVVAQKRRNRETVANALKIVSGAGAGLLGTQQAATPAAQQANSAIDAAIADLEK